MDVKKWLIAWFEKNADISANEAEENASSSYFDKGWIDSFKFIMFVSDIEQEFAISFSNEEFQNRDFSTISGLAKIIEAKIHAKK
jgi:acyl carrier protein